MVALSYALGQAVTGVFCRQKLGVSHLLHVERYKGTYGLQFAGNKRPDLFGVATQGWVVAEAKGRSRAMEWALSTKLNDQKRSVRSIAGEKPWLAVGCVACFPPPAGGMEVHAFDPEENEPEAVDIEATEDRFMLAYYLPFLNLIDFGQRIDDSGPVIASTYDRIGLTVAISRPLYELLQGAATDPMEGLAAAVREMLADPEIAEYTRFPDGTTVTTRWTEAISSQDWYTEF